MLRRSLVCGGVRHLDHLWQHFHVHSDQVILEAIHAERQLHGPSNRLVHKRCCKHCPGYRHFVAPDAIDPDSSGLSGTEARIGDYVRARGHVSLRLLLVALRIS